MTDSGGSPTFVLIGHPVGHSLSPAIHHAAYEILGLVDHRYVVVDCPDADSVARQIEALRRGEIAGANVTVPWKRLALELCDEVHASARDTRAANVLRPTGSNGACRLVAHNTDVPALAAELERGRPGARSAAVIGNGGAALAAVAACRAIGAGDVTVVARRWKGARTATWARADELAAMGALPVAWPEEGVEESDWGRAVAEADLVVQSTSDGMLGASDGTAVRDVVPWETLKPAAFVYDVVYNPAVTLFVEAARSRGFRAESGLGMLVGQAALAIELWLGRSPPLLPLKEAAERALAEKTRR